MRELSREKTGNNAVTREVMQDGTLYAHTVFQDDKALARNADIKTSGMLANAKLGLHDDEDMRMVISCPSTLQWATFRRKHAETYKLITSSDESERMKGCHQLQILEPAWVVFARL